MTITESLHQYLQSCPQSPQAFRLEDVTEDPILKQYISGETVRQKTFTLTTGEAFDTERVQDWLESQPLPILPDGKQAQRLDCLATGSLYTTAGQTSRCQIQIKLTYSQGGNTR
ncbi:MAG: hypothetical protein FWE12_00720 [Oscillospiraceae bacterium]|nr:hypothetical protein [Oscillospiraceae bacterium]